MIKPYPGLIIKEDVQFYPGVYDFYMQPGITVEADNITIDANDAVFINGQPQGNKNSEGLFTEFTYGDSECDAESRGYYGIALQSKGTAGVTLKNMHAKGFLQGLKLEDCTQWQIQHNDFSYNYHNMDWGWENHPIRGAMHLLHCHHCTISDNIATDVWDALVLAHSNNNQIRQNNFSHTSNTGLKLWHACNNIIEDNNFSWGLRKSPGEVHARDSACVLVESGSNDNVFRKNNMTYGGDGFFIRSLNGWMSTGNRIEGNDMSFANNNAIEAWSDNNTYVNNKANHSSYGFWLGNSDQTVLIGNEVAYNGGNFHNAPEEFGNCGIAVVNGSGSHFKVMNNHIHHNTGPGLAIRYKEDYPSYHWIIENNTFECNQSSDNYKGHGVYVKNAKWVTFVKNDFIHNDGQDIYIDEHVSDVQYLPGGDYERPSCVLNVNSESFITNKVYTFDASKSKVFNNEEMHVRWDFGDGTISNEYKVSKIFKESGLYRVGLTVDDGEKANMSYLNIYVTPDSTSIGGTSVLKQWTLHSDREETKMLLQEVTQVMDGMVVGVKAMEGICHILTYQLQANELRDFQTKSHLCFLLNYSVESADLDGLSKRPVIILTDDQGKRCSYIPEIAYLNMYGIAVNEYKNNWMYLDIPLNGDDTWKKKAESGFNMNSIDKLSFEIGPHISSYCEFYLGAIKLYSKESSNY
ncbi:right-handed parallel beta-helix repeat-containing protein [Vallitalea okinawensis]|uniref:right-handed parallel beta-helix repeat-containing protein n=1 Tax=Vallitalea okinawensis TaxID=2078660 RepID=UPI001FA8F8CC|nr:right-handed parallel beta-helix repeat-containing protein [Vallitalea okinawensis]